MKIGKVKTGINGEDNSDDRMIENREKGINTRENTNDTQNTRLLKEQFAVNEISNRVKNLSLFKIFVPKLIIKLITKACDPMPNLYHQCDTDGMKKEMIAITVRSVKHDDEFCQI